MTLSTFRMAWVLPLFAWAFIGCQELPNPAPSSSSYSIPAEAPPVAPSTQPIAPALAGNFVTTPFLDFPVFAPARWLISNDTELTIEDFQDGHPLAWITYFFSADLGEIRSLNDLKNQLATQSGTTPVMTTFNGTPGYSVTSVVASYQLGTYAYLQEGSRPGVIRIRTVTHSDSSEIETIAAALHATGITP